MVPTALARPTVALTPASDNTIFSENGAQSNGAGSYIFVGKTNVGNTRRALVRFDLSTIPPGSTITAVSLTMNMSKTVAGSTPVSLHLANATWGEGTSDASGQEGTGAPATTNDATWTHRFYNTTTWSAAGGDFNPTPSATASVDGNGNYNWSSAAMLSNVQGWFGSPPANRGKLLAAYTTPLIPIDRPGQSADEKAAGLLWRETVVREITGNTSFWLPAYLHQHSADQSWNYSGRLVITESRLDTLVCDLVRRGRLRIPASVRTMMEAVA